MAAVAFHFQANPISRSKGQSAVASAAYRVAGKLQDDSLQKIFDYRAKGGVEYVHHAAPKNAPEWAQDIGAAWNKVEETENRKNSTLAFEYVAAFPHQLDEQQREYILKDFVREELTRKGFMVTAAIHTPNKRGDERNHHTHIMVWDRAIDADGAAANKDRRFSDLKQRGETLKGFKQKWAELGARQLERNGLGLEHGHHEADRWRHGYKTLNEQAKIATARGDLTYATECQFREATKHVGVAAVSMERKGKQTERGDLHRETETRNAERQDIREEINKAAEKLGGQGKPEQQQESKSQERGGSNAAINQGLGATLSAVESVAGILENFFVPQHTAQQYPKRGEVIEDNPTKTAGQRKAEQTKAANEAEQSNSIKRDTYGIEIDPERMDRIRRQWEEEERQRSHGRGHER
ncbi:MobA/MobL family protein [Methylovulum psychrotolerans]|uniref:Mobilization protein A n=1 Tax=Methylovulum psychrotolerans TaxID=1704499 RepID=A0A2S5CFY8_9GAMM|nr:MobA/MobL family protein [Methylovulum psychrotolerans]POZ49677.1 Mobilization protein A [Methylovulum psychrotolerans]